MRKSMCVLRGGAPLLVFCFCFASTAFTFHSLTRGRFNPPGEHSGQAVVVDRSCPFLSPPPPGGILFLPFFVFSRVVLKVGFSFLEGERYDDDSSSIGHD